MAGRDDAAGLRVGVDVPGCAAAPGGDGVVVEVVGGAPGRGSGGKEGRGCDEWECVMGTRGGSFVREEYCLVIVFVVIRSK